MLLGILGVSLLGNLPTGKGATVIFNAVPHPLTNSGIKKNIDEY